RAKVIARHVVDNCLLVRPGSGVEPCLRHYRRNMEGVGFSVRILGEETAGIAEGFGVALLHIAEAAKLAFYAVEIPVAIAVRGDSPRPANVIEYFHPLGDVNWEGELGYPGRARFPVLNIELGRRRVTDARLGAKVVFDTNEQVRLLTAHQ